MIPLANPLLIQWSPPPKDCVKLNVNVSWKDNEAILMVLAGNRLGHV